MLKRIGRKKKDEQSQRVSFVSCMRFCTHLGLTQDVEPRSQLPDESEVRGQTVVCTT